MRPDITKQHDASERKPRPLIDLLVSIILPSVILMILSSIPGVREVIIGRAIRSDATYFYTWLIRFCHIDVIDSYRNHPKHIDFADTLFRPVAGERISIDYQTS